MASPDIDNPPPLDDPDRPAPRLWRPLALASLPGAPGPEDDPRPLTWALPPRLPAGWYLLTLRCVAAARIDAAPLLELATRAGYAPGMSRALEVSPGRAQHRILLHLPSGLCALRITGSADAPVAADAMPTLRAVASLEAMLRLGVPAVREFRALGASWSAVARAAWTMLRQGGPGRAALALRNQADHSGSAQRERYRAWTKVCADADADTLQLLEQRLAAVPEPPRLAVLLPVYDPPEALLRACIDSVRQQAWPHWELCIADDASTAAHVRRVLTDYARADTRIKVVERPENGHIAAASNSALALATAPWLVLLDHDDLLAPEALRWVAHAITSFPEARLFYSDEDKLDADGRRYDPYLKPDWDPILALGHNLFSHLGVYATGLVRAVGGFRVGSEGSQDWDLLLRCSERIRREQIVHIPRVLYHWRAIAGSTALAPGEKHYAHVASQAAIRAHLERVGVAADVLPIPGRTGNWRIRRHLPEARPLVSIIIPTRDGGEVLRRCLEAIDAHTEYAPREILIVDNQSRDRATRALLQTAASRPDCRVLPFDAPFNFSRINNHAVQAARGELLLFLNDDTEPLAPGWLRELVSWGADPRIGAVGAMLYYPDNTIQHAGIVLGAGRERIAGHAWHRQPRGIPGDKCRAMLVREVAAVTAACMLVRREHFEAVGGFDEELAVAFNDVDLCLRLAQRGWRNVWTPHAELLHHESLSRGRETGGGRRRAHARECSRMRQRWGEDLLQDPYYHPALSLDRVDFTTWCPPRTRPPWGAGKDASDA